MHNDNHLLTLYDVEQWRTVRGGRWSRTIMMGKKRKKDYFYCIVYFSSVLNQPKHFWILWTQGKLNIHIHNSNTEDCAMDCAMALQWDSTAVSQSQSALKCSNTCSQEECVFLCQAIIKRIRKGMRRGAAGDPTDPLWHLSYNNKIIPLILLAIASKCKQKVKLSAIQLYHIMIFRLWDLARLKKRLKIVTSKIEINYWSYYSFILSASGQPFLTKHLLKVKTHLRSQTYFRDAISSSSRSVSSTPLLSFRYLNISTKCNKMETKNYIRGFRIQVFF